MSSASTTTEIPELETYEWASRGEEPDTPGEAAYEPLKEPKAQYDNDYQTKIHNDLANHRAALVSLRSRIGGAESRLDQLRTDHDDLASSFDSHNHDSRYYRQYRLYTRTESDDRYYTKAESDGRFAATDHTHDSRYYLQEDTYSERQADSRFLNKNSGGTVTGSVFIDNHGFGGSADIAFAIGDTDTGFHAEEDGSFELYANNTQIGTVGPSGVNITQGHLQKSGNDVWHTGNDGKGSGLGADTVDGYDWDDIKQYIDSHDDSLRSWVNDDFFDKGQSDGRYYLKGQTYSTSQANDRFSQQGHRHDGRYYTKSESNGRYSRIGHDHDGRYYQKSQTYSTSQANDHFSQQGHRHDGRYYTKSESNGRYLQTSGDSMRGHNITDVGILEVEQISNAGSANIDFNDSVAITHGGDDGMILYTDSGALNIIPFVNGNVRNGSKLWYHFGADEWTFNSYVNFNAGRD